MKKIMFNDKYGLTEAVLEGRKTVTRRIITPQPLIFYNCNHGLPMPNCDESYIARFSKDDVGETTYIKPAYQVGDIVAIAQQYSSLFFGVILNNQKVKELQNKAGWNNKMFVKASLMPHQIEILDVRVERLQDISDEDCIKEGVIIGRCGNKDHWMKAYYVPNENQPYTTPREAFACLIDKVGKKGTWESNPYVFRIEFKRVI